MKPIKNRLLLGFHYFLMWIGYFIAARAFFLIYHYPQTKQLVFYEIFHTFYHGLYLDISATGFIAIIPFFLILFSVFLPKKSISIALKAYTYFFVFILTLLLFIDVSIYNAWGIRVDSTIFNYINTPKIMLASISIVQLIFSVALWLLFSILISKLFGYIISKKIEKLQKGTLFEIPLFLVPNCFFNTSNQRRMANHTYQSE